MPAPSIRFQITSRPPSDMLQKLWEHRSSPRLSPKLTRLISYHSDKVPGVNSLQRDPKFFFFFFVSILQELPRPSRQLPQTSDSSLSRPWSPREPRPPVPWWICWRLLSVWFSVTWFRISRRSLPRAVVTLSDTCRIPGGNYLPALLESLLTSADEVDLTHSLTHITHSIVAINQSPDQSQL